MRQVEADAPGWGRNYGVGLLDVDQIQAVVSPVGREGQCGKSQMTVDADGTLLGTWMINDENFRTLGREKMTRR